MNVHVPYVTDKLREETIEAVSALECPVLWHDLTGDDHAYGRLLCDLWRVELGGFIICEQDVVPRPECAAVLTACPEDWCGFIVPLGGGPQAVYDVVGFGCTRFAGSLIQAYPDLMHQAMSIGDDGQEAFHWLRCDVRFGSVLTGVLGHAPCHKHYPPLAHLHDYPIAEQACPWPLVAA